MLSNTYAEVPSKNKEFSKGDQIRSDLAAKGFALMDVGKETIWRPCVPVQQEKPNVPAQQEKQVEESNSKFEKLKNYIFQLEDHLAEAQKHAYRLVKRHLDFGKAVKLLGDCEGNALGKVFSELGTKSESLSIKLQREVTIAERANSFRQYYELAKAIKFKEIDLYSSWYCGELILLFVLIL